METPANEPRYTRLGFFLEVLRRILRHPVGAVLAALAVVASSFGLAALIWNLKELAALTGAALMVFLGFAIAGQMLPISPSRRNYHAALAETRRRYPSSRGTFFWAYGVTLLIIGLYKGNGAIKLWDSTFAGACIMGGLIADLVWRRRHPDERARLAALRKSIGARRREA